jgi:DNA-binding MarR family transcriptional regulator
MAPVAELLAVDRTTLTAALKPLERKGLVKVLPHPNDGRSRVLKLTAKGRGLLEKALPIWQSTHAELESGIPGKADELRLMLNKLL